MDDDHEMFKIVVIGSSGTGKTNISTRYIKNQFSEQQKATVGVQFLAKLITVHDQKIKVTLWDTAGQQKYKSLSKVYYKGSSGVLIVYDVTDPQSYLDVQSWMRLANENLNLNEVVLMVVGNKVDLEEQRKVPTQRPIRQYKQKFDIDCWEVSAKTGYNVKEVFAELVEKIYKMNIGQGHIPFGESQIGDSIVGPDSILGTSTNAAKGPLNNNNANTRISKQIPQVILQQEEGPVNLMPNQKKQPIKPIKQQNQQPIKPNNANKNQKGQKLTNDKKKNGKKQKKSCC